MKRSVASAGGVLFTALAGAALWMRTHPSPVPYSQRHMLDLPQPFVTRRRLHGILAPQSGERLLEIGPGTGHYTVALADWVGPQGSVDALDVQQKFLDHTARRAVKAGLSNVHPTLGDVQALPYSDASFDGALIIGVIGEVPDRASALAELHRVLKPGGRLIVGEFFPPDPHVQPLNRLRPQVEAAGFTLARRTGINIGYFARFVA